MKRCIALLWMLGVLTSAHASPADIEPRVLTTFLDGELTVDPAGTVEAYRITTPVSDGMAAKIQAMVRELRFEPVVANGQPARAHTTMRVTLTGQPTDDGGLDVHLDNVSFPKSETSDSADRPVRMSVDQRSTIDYPIIGLRNGLDADVLVVVRAGLDGRIEDAAIRQSALIAAGGDPELVAKVLHDFEYQSLRAAKRWTLKVDVPAGAQPTAEQLTGLIAMQFRTQERVAARAGDWIWETRSRKRATPWLPPEPGATLVGVADVSGDGVGHDDTRFRLATPLAPAGS